MSRIAKIDVHIELDIPAHVPDEVAAEIGNIVGRKRNEAYAEAIALIGQYQAQHGTVPPCPTCGQS